MASVMERAMTKTTITRAALEQAAQKLVCTPGELFEAVTALIGYAPAIAPPEPPEGVVKLAFDAQKQASTFAWPSHAWRDGFIAAIMHARQAVESAESALHISFGVETALPESVRRADILRQLGGTHD